MTEAVVCGSDAGGPPQTMPTVAYDFPRDHDPSEALYHDLRSRCVGITPQTLRAKCFAIPAELYPRLALSRRLVCHGSLE